MPATGMIHEIGKVHDMTLQECYAALGGDYNEALSRLMSDRLVSKFVIKFLDDGSYELLGRSLQAGNIEEAFRAAHTIKGMCLNLAFTRLANSSIALTEELRAGHTDVDALYQEVVKDYKITVDAINAYKASIQ